MRPGRTRRRGHPRARCRRPGRRVGDVVGATAVPPSGEQFEIEAGSQRATVTEVGATLRSYSVDGIEVLDGFEEGEPSNAGRGQILAPWPNRLEDGRYTFEGAEGRAALDEPDRGNAIHGLVRWLPWRVSSRSPSAIALDCVLHPQPAYPWRLALSVEYSIEDTGLTVAAAALSGSGHGGAVRDRLPPVPHAGVIHDRRRARDDPRPHATEADERGPSSVRSTSTGTSTSARRSRSDGSSSTPDTPTRSGPRTGAPGSR